MHFSTTSEALADALSRVEPVSPKQSTTPILSHMLLEVSAGVVTLSATNLEAYATASFNTLDARDGVVCVPSSTFRSIIDKLDGEVTVSETEKNVTVKSGRSTFRLAKMPVDVFPTMAAESETSFIMDGKDLSDALKAVYPFASKDGARYYLNAVFMEAREDILNLVSTDGHRLAQTKAHYAEMPEKAFNGVLISRAHVPLIQRFLEGEVKVEVSGSDVKFSTDMTSILCRTVDGSFPDYERVIPSHDSRFVFNNSEMLKAIELVGTILTAGTAALFNVGESEVSIIGHGDGKGDADMVVSISDSNGPISVGLNVDYLADILRSSDFEEVFVFHGQDGQSPLLIKDAENGSESGSRFVLMPMRV